MLRLFGIPYVTAPMEAEAQCAELARLNLVDGVITDDNDVFLFGASQCFKNLFNDAKYVECFLAVDLAREMSLTRERLISLAYLLGSDYTEGLPGIGPVAGMEIMAQFPGPHGLQNFKAWWTAVQQGKDDVENESKWQKSFVSCPGSKTPLLPLIPFGISEKEV
jgi:DNA excision repair protein ERCC-5